ncbi:MAG: hypothetical protein KAJ54_02185 [Candidatus Aenigmarchaeota archaeon]|nr:hypothetical protein [Candidatus Aenigmarchaeota archaeon]
MKQTPNNTKSHESHKRVCFIGPNSTSTINVLEDELMTKLPASLILLSSKISGEPLWKVLKEYLVIESYLDEDTRKVMVNKPNTSFDNIKDELINLEKSHKVFDNMEKRKKERTL